jgi:hypothetical protein
MIIVIIPENFTAREKVMRVIIKKIKHIATYAKTFSQKNTNVLRRSFKESFI